MKYYTIKEVEALGKKAGIKGFTKQNILKTYLKTGIWEAYQTKKGSDKAGKHGSTWLISELSVPAFLRN